MRGLETRRRRCRLSLEPAGCISSWACSISVHAKLPHVPHLALVSLQDGAGSLLAYREARCSQEEDKDSCVTWVCCQADPKAEPAEPAEDEGVEWEEAGAPADAAPGELMTLLARALLLHACMQCCLQRCACWVTVNS